MISKSDGFILLAVAISFVLSAWLWFFGQRTEALFTAMWVLTILAFGIYFKLMMVQAALGQEHDDDQ